MNTRSRMLLFALPPIGLATAALVLWSIKAHDSQSQLDPRRHPHIETGQNAYARGHFDDAIEELSRFIKEAEGRPERSEEVGRASLRMGYALAKLGRWSDSRAVFLETAERHSDTQNTGGEYGSISDQAAYQAAVCLQAEGRPEDAARMFSIFLKERPLSPLVFSAHRRLSGLADHQSSPEADRLLQAAVRHQEDHVKAELAVCGPKAIAHLLKRHQEQPLDYRAIAKLCGTSEAGTTVAGMIQGLEALGLDARAYLMTARDIRKLEGQAIMLLDRHFVTLETRHADRVTVYDPLIGALRDLPLPPDDDKSFGAVVIHLPPNKMLPHRS
jgi:tetratricopeptide (TPR) repeat protein